MGYTAAEPMPVYMPGASTGPVPVSEGGGIYGVVAASQTDSDIVAGSDSLLAGAANDVLVSVRVRPEDVAAAGNVVVKDGATVVDTFTAAQIDGGDRFRWYGYRAKTKWTLSTPSDVSAVGAVKRAVET